MFAPQPEKHYFSPGLLTRFDIDIAEIPPPYQPTQEQSKTKISFHPDTDTFFARRARTVLTGGLQKSVPDRWPAVLDGRMVWKGSDFNDESDFVYHMSGKEQVEISQALEAFKSIILLYIYPISMSTKPGRTGICWTMNC